MLFTQLKRTTSWGYSIFRCQQCQRDYNQRTGTPFNHIELPTDILFEVLLCRVRYKLSYRDVAKYFLYRGFEFTHETVRDWEGRFLPLLTEQIRAKAKSAKSRRLTKPMSGSKGSGAICIEGLTSPAI